MSSKNCRFSRVLKIATLIVAQFKDYFDLDTQTWNPTIKIALEYCALLVADSEVGVRQNVNSLWNDPDVL